MVMFLSVLSVAVAFAVTSSASMDGDMVTDAAQWATPDVEPASDAPIFTIQTPCNSEYT